MGEDPRPPTRDLSPPFQNSVYRPEISILIVQFSSKTLNHIYQFWTFMMSHTKLQRNWHRIYKNYLIIVTKSSM